MMNTTMNRQENKTLPADMSSVVLSLQLHNLILRPNLKPKITSHSQNRPSPYQSYLNSPLSVDDLVRISYRGPLLRVLPYAQSTTETTTPKNEIPVASVPY